jgi:hypothetical protein
MKKIILFNNYDQTNKNTNARVKRNTPQIALSLEGFACRLKKPAKAVIKN